MKTFHYSVMMSGLLMIMAIVGRSLLDPPYEAALADQLTSTNIEIRVSASADAFVNEIAPTTNYGNSAGLDISKNEFLQERFAFLRFDLSAIPTGSSVISATFNASVRDTDQDPGNARLSIYWVIGAWSENTITWNNKPSTVLTSHYNDIPPLADSTNGLYRSWSVTDIVQCWVDKAVLCDDATLALRAHPNYQTLFHRQFASRETTHRPYLKIIYAPPTPTPTNTFTPTYTPTKTSTPTITNTPTNTPTGTRPPIDTPTNTSTPTNTPTNTPTITSTPTPTPTMQRASIGGRVWQDANHNGQIDAGEPSMTSATITLVRNGETLAETGINANGDYLFANLEPNLFYRIYVDEVNLQPLGYERTTPNNPLLVNPSPGQAVSTANFGYASRQAVRERIDTWIMGIEVNQGLQDIVFTDLANPGNRRGFADPQYANPIILGKPAVVRVFVGLRDSPDRPQTPANGFAVSGEIHVSTGAIGDPGQRLTPITNPNCTEHMTSSGQSCQSQIGIFPSLGRQGLNTNSDYDLDLIAARTQLGSTLNFVIPPELTGQFSHGQTMIIVADIWPVGRDEVQGWDNQFELQLDNIAAPNSLTIDLIRIGGTKGETVWPRPSTLAAERTLTQMVKLMPYDQVIINRNRTFTTNFRRARIEDILGGNHGSLSECDTLWLRLFQHYRAWVMDGHTIYALTPVNISLGNCNGIGWKIPGFGGIGYAEAPPFAETGTLIQSRADEEAVAVMAQELYHTHRDHRHVSNDHGEEDGCPAQGLLDFIGGIMNIDSDCWKPSLHPHGVMGEYPAGAVKIGNGGMLTGRIFGDHGAMGIRIEKPDNEEWRLTLYDACPTGPIDRSDPLNRLGQRWDVVNSRYRCALNDDRIPHDFMSYGPNRWTSEDQFQGITVAPALVASQAKNADQTVTEAGLLVSGFIGSKSETGFTPVLPALAGTALGSSSNSTLSLTVQTQQGQSLTLPVSVALGPAHTGVKLFFASTVPAGVQPMRMALVANNQEIIASTASANPPTVHVLWPDGDPNAQTSGEHLIRWEASDTDGDELTFVLDASTDGGQTWQPLGSVIADTSLNIPDEASAPIRASSMLIRITASDGMNLVSDLSDNLAGENRKLYLPLVNKS